MDGLVDLSLFEWNPTGTSTAHGLSCGNAEYYQSALSGAREFYAPTRQNDGAREMVDIEEAIRQSIHESLAEPQSRPVAADQGEGSIRETIVDASRRREVTMKPLPALPRTRICQQIADDGSQCILKRIKRNGTDQTAHSPGSLLYRRSATVPPQLTLSVPLESTQIHNDTSDRDPRQMVWMPDDQMWLVVGEAEQRTSDAAQAAYPTPSTYTPRVTARSEPSSRVTSQWDITPPQTPIQFQLQSLLQQPRDEERFSPLFQEAMNSVPLTDQFDLPPPPSYEGTMCRFPPIEPRPHTAASEYFLPSISASPNASLVHRTRTVSNQRPRMRSDTSNERSCQTSVVSTPHTANSRQPNHGRSYHSTNSGRNYQIAPPTIPTSSPSPAAGLRSWQGLAQRLARSRSTT